MYSVQKADITHDGLSNVYNLSLPLLQGAEPHSRVLLSQCSRQAENSEHSASEQIQSGFSGTQIWHPGRLESQV